MNEPITKHIIVAKVDNKPGVVSRMSGLFTRRGYNIESFVTSVTNDPAVYHLTISVLCSHSEAQLMVHQLGRLVEIIDVYDTADKQVIAREFMLVKVNCDVSLRPEIVNICDKLKLKIAGFGNDTAIIEVTGEVSKLDSITLALEPYGIREVVRSGIICMEN